MLQSSTPVELAPFLGQEHELFILFPPLPKLFIVAGDNSNELTSFNKFDFQTFGNSIQSPFRLKEGSNPVGNFNFVIRIQNL